ncbi:hypothetical protein ACP4OV_009266 [Aristida adscensionis]
MEPESWAAREVEPEADAARRGPAATDERRRKSPGKPSV